MDVDRRLEDLLVALLEQHRPVRQRDAMAYREQYLVQCRACDGNKWQIWCPGDAPHYCNFWRLGCAEGLVNDGYRILEM